MPKVPDRSLSYGEVLEDLRQTERRSSELRALRRLRRQSNSRQAKHFSISEATEIIESRRSEIRQVYNEKFRGV